MKTLALVLGLSIPAVAIDCGVYYQYGTRDYALCRDNERQALIMQGQANLDRFNTQVNAQLAQDRQAAQAEQTNMDLQALLRALQQASQR